MHRDYVGRRHSDRNDHVAAHDRPIGAFEFSPSMNPRHTPGKRCRVVTERRHYLAVTGPIGRLSISDV
jgi:hypothetical protein